MNTSNSEQAQFGNALTDIIEELKCKYANSSKRPLPLVSPVSPLSPPRLTTYPTSQ